MIALTSILFCSWCGIVLSFQPKLKFKIEKFTRLYVESLDSKLSIETSIPSNNDNSDNNNIIIDDSNNINSSNNGDGRSSTLPPRVYKSKSQLQPISEARIVSGSALVLVNPQFLIRYRAPKVKSGLKTQLEELQEIYRGSDSGGRDNFSRGGGGGSSGGRSRSDDAAGKFEFGANLPAFKKGKGKIPTTSKEDRKSANENSAIAKSNENRRFKIDSMVDDVEESTTEEEDDDYYGDEEVTSMTLSSVPADQLRGMEQDGFSFEEIQMSLYGEYGIKVSVQAIKRRLADDKLDRKTGARSGKTRRSKNKARQSRLHPVDDRIKLPSEGSISIKELAELLDVSGGDVVKHLMLNMGMMSSMNQNIDVSLAKTIVLAFGKTLLEGKSGDNGNDDDSNDNTPLKPTIPGGLSRPPIVTIMGHVDHGKTTLLDNIRKTQIALGEAGGITQGISAFKVKTSIDNKEITFMDTPGHAAFSEMRKRGANMTDIVILVVAADDGVMEQTIECILAAKSANCPVVVAVNKIDKEGANTQKILEDLMKYNIVVEEFGGDAQAAQISAKQGIGIEDLLDKVLLQADVMDLTSKPTEVAEGTIIEASVDKRLGAVSTALVQHGNLRVGDIVLAGSAWGKVRRLLSDQGKELKLAGPSTPVQIVGLSSVPNAGDSFVVVESEENARSLAEARQRISRQTAGSMSTANILAQATGLAGGTFDGREILKIPIVLKADVAGSVEALITSIQALEVSDAETVCKIDIVSASVGDITFSDVAIAAAAKAKIIAFNVGPGQNVMDAARSSNVAMEFYNVVYDALDNLEKVVQTTFAPPPPGLLLGKAEIKKSFKLGKLGYVAGCKVLDGVIRQDSKVRVLRGKRNQIYLGSLESLRVGKESVSEVPNGSDCGMHFVDFQDFAEGDIVESFANA